MQITDDHVEWAIVNRLQKMLEEPPHSEFNVTHTYALFVPIICWTLQRIRANGRTGADALAANVLNKLKRQKIEEAPWKIVPDGEGFQGMSADRFLINLRNAVAHGDARRIRPFHRTVRGQSSCDLVGFSFQCEEKDNRNNTVWTGTIKLREDDLRRIGIELAKAFCRALRGSDRTRHDSSFGKDANDCVIERAA
jgi:hypothetical protein